MAKAVLRGQLQAVLQRLTEQVDDPALSPLAAATILDALGSVPGSAAIAKTLMRRVTPLLDEQWIMTADLCTVFSVLAALHGNQPATVQGRYLAYALKRLMACELQPGGPYCSEPGKPEPAANAAIARFLQHYDVDLPQLVQYLDDVAVHRPVDSPVVTDAAFWYLSAPVLSPAARDELSKRLLTQSCPAQPPQAALRASTLRLLGIERRVVIDKLMAPLESPKAALLPIRKMVFYIGTAGTSARLLTDAITAEALAALAAKGTAKARVSPVGSTQLHTDILRDTKRYMSELPDELRKTGLDAWDAMRRADHNHEVVLMPHLFVDALKDMAPVGMQQLRLLGAANFFCWIAATIYDDFIDEEGEPGRLPVANTAYRLSLNLYRQALTVRPVLSRYVEHVYDQMDAANAWEVAHTRAVVAGEVITLPQLPNYDDRSVLARRALGHVLGPMLVAMLLPGIRPKQIDAIDKALQHYLIARQLNDDLHDWRKDLRAGHLSAIVVNLLHGAGVQPGKHKVMELVRELEKYFFKQGLYDACNLLTEHVHQARQALASSGVCGASGGFIHLLDDLEASAAAAVGVQTDEQAFLDAYRESALHAADAN